MIFGLLWILAYYKANVNFITMYAASTYYFDSSAEKEGYANVGAGVKAAFTNHPGSLAFGSFIITLVRVIDAILVTICHKIAEASGDNGCVKCMVCCAECCLGCLEKIVDYVTKGAYAYMAVSGQSFCTSAWHGFLLHMKHGLEFSFAMYLAEVFIIIGKLAISFGNMAFVYGLMKAFKLYDGP